MKKIKIKMANFINQEQKKKKFENDHICAAERGCSMSAVPPTIQSEFLMN